MKTGTYAYEVFVQLDTVSKEDLQKECHALFETRPRDQQTTQRYSDWLACSLVGERELAEDAADGFFKGALAINKEEWLNAGRFMKREIGEGTLLAAFEGRRLELAHAHFLFAIDRLSRGDRDGAKRSFEEVVALNQFLYVDWWSKVFLERLENPDWLSWLPDPEQPKRQ